MNAIAIITIAVISLLTLVIFGLVWLGYNSCLKLYESEVRRGKHDREIRERHDANRKGIIGTLVSWLVLLSLLGLFATGIAYRVRGENLSIQNQTALVIKSGSMSDFHDEKIAQKYNHDRSLQFDVGDICLFEPVTYLKEGDVYGYKDKNVIITHRLVKVFDDFCEFRGDRNFASDTLVPKDAIVYHYTGSRFIGIGSFVLYAQSYFGIWSLLCVIGIAVSSEIVNARLANIEKRYLKARKKK